VGFSQGVFRVVHDTAGRRDLVTPRPLLATGGSPEPVKRGDPDRPLLELIEFRTLVRDLVAGRTR
jgi:hypothetical protein